ncbi:MAG: prolipoprotein diacylglyceryl transferase [Acidobacteria bacterium]|nr:prolipoprotein diacylglyceryl transferase [Acidobacteriota bacterium]
MIEINWNPVSYLGPMPINWYGITMALGFLGGGWLVWRWAPRFDVPRTKIENLVMWILVGTVVGARGYYLVQNDFGSYLAEPWRMLAVWEGGLAFFGGLFGGTLAAFLYTWREGLKFPRVADLFAPAISVGAAIRRISCGLAGMDYGTPTSLPWGVVYTNPNSYAPVDGVARHPDQYYELLGDLVIAGILITQKWRVAVVEAVKTCEFAGILKLPVATSSKFIRQHFSRFILYLCWIQRLNGLPPVTFESLDVPTKCKRVELRLTYR